MSPAVPPLATVTAIAVRPPGSRMQITPSTSFGDTRKDSLEIDCDAGTMSGAVLTAALAVAMPHDAATGARSTLVACQSEATGKLAGGSTVTNRSPCTSKEFCGLEDRVGSTRAGAETAARSTSVQVRGRAGLAHDESSEYANLRYVEEQNRDTARGRPARVGRVDESAATEPASAGAQRVDLAALHLLRLPATLDPKSPFHPPETRTRLRSREKRRGRRASERHAVTAGAPPSSARYRSMSARVQSAWVWQRHGAYSS